MIHGHTGYLDCGTCFFPEWLHAFPACLLVRIQHDIRCVLLLWCGGVMMSALCQACTQAHTHAPA